jgi:hypothetical protein
MGLTILVAGRQGLLLVLHVFVARHLADAIMAGRAPFSIVTAVMDASAPRAWFFIRFHIPIQQL